jgi:SAM-dependent methyltransferase
MTMPYFSHADARTLIQEAYGRVESSSDAVARSLYRAEEVAGLPPGAVALALGVGHPVRHAALRPGEVVLDLGCGAGIDTLLAARAVGPVGRVIGLDMTASMIERARRHAAEAGFAHVEIREGLIEEIPVADATVDVVVSNGVLNLSTRKSRVLAEVTRVLRPGGRVSIADLVLNDTLPEEVLKSPAAFAG